MRKTAILYIILALALSWSYQVPAASCFQSAQTGLCMIQSHKACHLGSCALNPSHKKACRLKKNHSVRHGGGRACCAHIECSHHGGSPFYSSHAYEDVYLPTRNGFEYNYSFFSYVPIKEVTYEKDVAFPIERPPIPKNL